MKTTSCLRSDVPFRSPFWACSRSRSPALPKRGSTGRPQRRRHGLQAFLLRTDETPKHEFNRTPSFAWLPVRGALRYEFELATSRSFTRELDHLVEHERRARGRDDHDDRGRRRRDRDRLGGREDEGALHESQVAGGVDRPCPALDHRLALRALRPRPCAHDERPHAVEQAFRLQHSLVECPA